MFEPQEMEATVMDAIVQDTYGSADVLMLRQMERPEIRDDELLIRVVAAGVDRGAWHLMTGVPYLMRIFGVGLRAPKNRVPGTNVAGRVDAVGAKVTTCKAGDSKNGTGTASVTGIGRAKAQAIYYRAMDLYFTSGTTDPQARTATLNAATDL